MRYFYIVTERSLDENWNQVHIGYEYFSSLKKAKEYVKFALETLYDVTDVTFHKSNEFSTRIEHADVESELEFPGGEIQKFVAYTEISREELR